MGRFVVVGGATVSTVQAAGTRTDSTIPRDVVSKHWDGVKRMGQSLRFKKLFLVGYVERQVNNDFQQEPPSPQETEDTKESLKMPKKSGLESQPSKTITASLGVAWL